MFIVSRLCVGEVVVFILGCEVVCACPVCGDGVHTLAAEGGGEPSTYTGVHPLA